MLCCGDVGEPTEENGEKTAALGPVGLNAPEGDCTSAGGGEATGGSTEREDVASGMCSADRLAIGGVAMLSDSESPGWPYELTIVL